jgi:hypothetical protein
MRSWERMSLDEMLSEVKSSVDVWLWNEHGLLQQPKSARHAQ